jgi:alkanesulfonate monooxygenase SsuD/methylene tetrahydromethanopterin reductase-like flavin-dependent oxidoreductase (luciferase family)
MVHHQGEHYTVDGMRFLPRPVQKPRVPVWVAGFYGNRKPLRRAARYDGVFPINLEHPDQLAEVVADVTALRREAGMDMTAPYDVAVTVPPGTDPTPYVVAGATWWMVELRWDDVSVDQVRGVVRDGPAAPSRRRRSSPAQKT